MLRSSPRPLAEGNSTPPPTIFKVAFGLGIASVFLGGTFGLLAWTTVAVSAWALYSEKADLRRWMPWTALVLGIVFSFMNANLNGYLDGLFAPADGGTTLPTSRPRLSTSSATTSPKVASIGLSVDDFIESWNSVAVTVGRPSDKLVDLNHSDTNFTSEIGSTGFIQVFHYGSDQVGYLHFESMNPERFEDLVDHACRTVLDRSCTSELYEAWDTPSQRRVVSPQDAAVEGNCWTYVKASGYEEVRIEPLGSSC